MRVVVAMSGGVDSSTTAALLQEQGHEVVGVHMRLHDASSGRPGLCCGLDDALDARSVADRLGIAFHVMDLRRAFQEAVIDDLAQTYLEGGTPNPCVRCNGVLKFRVLLSRALALGAEALATGHYARVLEGRLHRALDEDKDQSYFLFPIEPEALERTLFPLGDLPKDQVRELARRFGLVTADKAESQEICFIPEGDHAQFIAEQRPGVKGSGDIVDLDGRVLGRHDGYWRYTVGQRRGLRVALGVPVYVERVEPDTHRVVVAAQDHLWHHALQAGDWTWQERPEEGASVHARIRHRGALVPCHLEGDIVCFHEPAWAVAPGQAVVLYSGDRVLGGGWIRRVVRDSRGAA
ncbi:MAG TPA: tRNA 2-thiouridine(34) synthase MnmA [Myxococcota bacterium]|nr:tRNA 2-thiouridine(34) synthase MnmA [Myxococcota bacterium]